MNDFQLWVYRRFMMEIAYAVIHEVVVVWEGDPFDAEQTAEAFERTIQIHGYMGAVELWTKADWEYYGQCEAEVAEWMARDLDTITIRDTMEESQP